jgi:hypothetical protein
VDYEAVDPKGICFSLVATDGGGGQNTIQAVVTITNVNDVQPIWDCANRDFNNEYKQGAPCFYDDELRADTLVDYLVLTVLSTDGDTINSEQENNT